VRSPSDTADQGLLTTLLELDRDETTPPTSANVARAVGIPAEYAHVIVQRLHENEARGLVGRDLAGNWRVTRDGLAAAESGLGRLQEISGRDDVP